MQQLQLKMEVAGTSRIEGAATYGDLKNPNKARIRDFNDLVALGAVFARKTGSGGWVLGINLDWPQQITESDFMERVKQLPKSKMHSFL